MKKYNLTEARKRKIDTIYKAIKQEIKEQNNFYNDIEKKKQQGINISGAIVEYINRECEKVNELKRCYNDLIRLKYHNNIEYAETSTQNISVADFFKKHKFKICDEGYDFKITL